MPSFCSVVGCSMRAERDKVRFFRIPAKLKSSEDNLNALSKRRRESWVRALKRGSLSDAFLRNARICSKHFVSGAPAKQDEYESPDCIATQMMGYTTIMKKDEKSVERYERSRSRSKQLQPANVAGNFYLPEDDPMEGCSRQFEDVLHQGIEGMGIFFIN